MQESITTTLAATIGLTGSFAYFSPWLWRRNRMKHIRREMIQKRMLSLTYDDGPSDLTLRVLDILALRGARATFFMLGRHVQLYPEIVSRVVKEGHDVACHSDQHLNAWKKLPWEAIADINAGYERLSPWIQPNGMFRPPHGKMTLPTYLSILRRGAPVWWWTIDSGDTHEVLPSANQVAERFRMEGGAIVLMHDLNRTEQRNKFVLQTTSTLLDVAQSEGFQVKPLSAL